MTTTSPEDDDLTSPPVEVFSTYLCSSINFGNPHPGLITEAGSLSAIKLPPAQYPLTDSLPSSVIFFLHATSRI
jgi:hypothetical protein